MSDPTSPGVGPFVVRSMDERDLRFVIAEHQQHFPGGFFVRLGPSFLTEYYRTYLTGEDASAYVAELGGEPVGFLVGVTDPAEHRRHVLRHHGRPLARRALTALLRHPSMVVLFLRTRALRYTRKLLRAWLGSPARPAPHEPRGTPATLTHVAVAAEAQGQGIGAALIDRLEADAVAAGCARLALVTVSGDRGAGAYYERSGWAARGQHLTPDGLHLTTYERSLPT